MGMDHYTILKQLGGTTGTFLAVDKQNESRKVVIKRLMDGTQGVQELNVSLRVRHPHIITFLESFVHDGALYVVLAYAEGGDLEAYLEHMAREKKPLQHALLLRWFKQLIEALQCCHEQHIMHRDVKPGNVFLNAEKTELYLGDFGSAKSLLRSVSLTTTFVGTPIWISPELLTGTPYSYPADIWSLGCVFYEMVALKRPFSPSSFANLVQQITSGDITPLPATVPEDMRKIIMSMLQVDPNKRCTLAKALEMTERAAQARASPPAKGRESTEHVQNEKVSPPQRRKNPPPKTNQFQRLPTRRPPLAADASPKDNGYRGDEEEGKTSAVGGEKLKEWIHARNHDVSVIQRYLNKFRQSDEEVLIAAAASPENAPHDREQGVTMESPKRMSSSPERAQRDVMWMRSGVVFEARAAVLSPPCAKPAVKPRVRFPRKKSSTRPNGRNGIHVNRNASPLAREPSSFHSLNGDVLKAARAFKKTPSVFRNKLPLHPSPGREKERQLVREKREQERNKMLEMIREQKAKAMQERKARGLSEARGAVAVEIVLPDNLRYVDGAAK